MNTVAINTYANVLTLVAVLTLDSAACRGLAIILKTRIASHRRHVYKERLPVRTVEHVNPLERAVRARFAFLLLQNIRQQQLVNNRTKTTEKQTVE